MTYTTLFASFRWSSSGQVEHKIGEKLGNLRDQIFNGVINGSLESLRGEMGAKYKHKKGNRFFTGGITYEVSDGKMLSDGVQFEISSKIPQEILDTKKLSEKYFKEMKKLMTSKDKSPADVKMENIIHSTNISELKEREYVKCTYVYSEDELYTEKDIAKTVKQVQDGEKSLPEIRGVTTLPGRVVLHMLRESVHQGASTNITDLIESNEAVIKNYKKNVTAVAK